MLLVVFFALLAVGCSRASSLVDEVASAALNDLKKPRVIPSIPLVQSRLQGPLMQLVLVPVLLQMRS